MKTLDLTPIIKQFNGEPFQDEGKPLTLKSALLFYINCAHLMRLTKVEEAALYGIGVVISRSESITMDQSQYDALKKITDLARFFSNGEEVPIYGIAIAQQVKQFVDAAENVKE